MAKILFLHHGLGLGGAEMMRFILLANIDKNKYGIKICCIGEKGILGKDLEAMGYKVDELRQNPNSLSLSITCKVIKYLKKEKPDILHTSLFNSNFHGRLANFFCRIPYMITEEHGEHKQYKGIKFIPHKFMDFVLSFFTDFIVCCSDKLKEDIVKIERLPRSKLVAIENCLDLKKYKIKINREELKKRYKITDELVFITVARLKAGKGHEYFIEALYDIKKNGYFFKCLFIGEGPLKEVLRERCCKLGLSDEVIFLGDVNGIADFLNISDIFVLPSFSEGLSLALMEGMLAGLASIVTDVGSNSDLIKAGFNGIVVLPGDKEGLKNAIVYCLKNENLIKKFGERSKPIIEARYSSIVAYTRKYYELWDKCLDNKG